VRAVERGSVADGDEGIVKAVASALVVVHVSGRNHGQTLAISDVRERSREALVATNRVALEFDEKAVSSEYRAAAICEPSRCR
jgi:hypothetical protein